MAGLVGYGLVIGGGAVAFTAFAVASLVMATLLFLFGVLGGRWQRLAGVARRRGGGIKRWGGAVMIGVGFWLVALAVFSPRLEPLLFP